MTTLLGQPAPATESEPDPACSASVKLPYALARIADLERDKQTLTEAEAAMMGVVLDKEERIAVLERELAAHRDTANCARALNAPPAPDAHGPYRTAGALAEGAEVIVIDGTVMKLERQAPVRWRTMPRPPGIPRETDRVVIIRRWLEAALALLPSPVTVAAIDRGRREAFEEALMFVNGLGTASECAPPAATEMCPSGRGHELKRVFLPERGLRGKHYCECGWEL